MIKKVIMAASVCILLIGIVVFAVTVGKQPYKDLDASEILSATVRLAPPGKTLPVADTEELTECLQDVIIYNRDDSYRTIDGLSVTYTLTMTDGTQTEIMPYSSCLVIDGSGYRTEQEPCNALISYANKLFNEENTVAILTVQDGYIFDMQRSRYINESGYVFGID